MSRQVQLSESCEGADDYKGTLVRLSEHCRIVICRDAKQWVVQTRDGQRAGAARWTGRGYAQTQEGLLRVLRHLQRLSDDTEALIRSTFPQHIRLSKQQDLNP